MLPEKNPIPPHASSREPPMVEHSLPISTIKPKSTLKKIPIARIKFALPVPHPVLKVPFVPQALLDDDVYVFRLEGGVAGAWVLEEEDSLAVELVCLPVSLVGHLARRIVEGALPLHIVFDPLPLIDRSIREHELAGPVPEAIDFPAFVAGSILVFLLDVLAVAGVYPLG